MLENRRIVLATRPNGMPVSENFRLESQKLPELAPDSFLVKNAYLGLAPAARIWMDGDSAFYGESTPVGAVIHGQSLGTIVASRKADFKEGDKVVLNTGGWQEYSISDGARVLRVDDKKGRETLWLGALGVSGMTAYVGLMNTGLLKPGEIVAVSAASGGVGAMAGQIAKAFDCRVIGIAGGSDKCRYISDELGFDSVDYKAPDFDFKLTEACSSGVDLFFDNVGGSILARLLPRMNAHGRIVVCGLIADYNGIESSVGPSWIPILAKRLTVRGFSRSEHWDMLEEFTDRMSGWLREGKVKVKEDFADGLESTVDAFIRMLEGKNFGKTVVRL